MHRTFLLLSFFLNCVFMNGQQIETVVQTGHYAPVTDVCYSYDGKFIATGGSDKTIILWRSSDGRELRSFRGSSSAVIHVEFSRHGNNLLSLDAGGECIIWDVSTGGIIQRKKPDNDRFTSVSLNPAATLIAAGTRESGILVLDVTTGEIIKTVRPVPEDNPMQQAFDYPVTRSVRFSNDGKYILAGAGNYTAILFEAETGREIRKFKKTWGTCTSCESEAVFSPDDKFICTSYSDSVKIFDRASGKFIRELAGQGGDPEGLSVSNDMKLLAGVEYGNGQVWDIASGNILFRTGDYNEDKIFCAAISPDNRYIVTGSSRRLAEVQEIKSGKKVLSLRGYLNQADERLLSHPSMYWVALINEAKLSPDGSLIAVGRAGNNVRLIDFKTGRVTRTLAGHRSMVISLSFSKDGKYLITGGLDGQVIVWNVEMGTIFRKISSEAENMPIFSVDISHDGRMFAAASWDGLVYIYDLNSGKLLQAISPHEKTGVYQVKFSENDVYVISAGLDGRLKLSEIDSGEEVRIFKGHTDLVNSVDLSPDGDKIITAGLDGTIRVWDFLSGIQVLKIRAHPGGVFAARFDPSGKYILSGGDDFVIREWSAANGTMIMELAGHKGAVGDVAMTPDHRFILSGSRDGSLRIWDVNTRKELTAMIFLNQDDWFIRNPAGYFDASQGAFGSISFVKGTELYSISQFFNEFYRPGLYTEALSGQTASHVQDVKETIDKFPPPSVEFISPSSGSTSEQPGLTCMIKVINNGGGVSELRVMHNGKRQAVDDSDLPRMSKNGQESVRTFDLVLVPGENEINISALSKGGIESGQESITVNYNGLQRTAECYVLSVGINRYENEDLTLTYARPDAQAFASFMDSNSRKLFSKIHTRTIVDREATKENILAAIDEIGKTMRKEDVFVFFYAGHGSVNNNSFYFVTSEITGLYQDDRLKNALRVADLQEKFRNLPALKQVVLVDACHSGSSVEGLAMRGATEEKALAQLSRSSGVHVLASSDSRQQSAEIKSLGHGVFTYVLLEALKGKADGAPADSKITVYEIKSYLDDQVPEISYKLIRHKQFPSTFSVGHDFPLVTD